MSDASRTPSAGDPHAAGGAELARPAERAASDDAELARLAERAARGDAAALETLLERYLPALRAFVRVHMSPQLRARESTSDVVQSVCRELLTHAERFRHPSEQGFKQWLFKTAQRKISNRAAYLRREKRELAREVRWPARASGEEAALGRVYASLSTPSQKLAAREEIERVEAALDQLTDEQREVLVLAHLVGLSRAEIGSQVGKSEVAVRGLLHRALARVALLLPAE